jgi:hypothetical protein
LNDDKCKNMIGWPTKFNRILLTDAEIQTFHWINVCRDVYMVLIVTVW